MIEYATLNDLEIISEIENAGFLEAEAASKESMKKRLEAFSNHFWMLNIDGVIVGYIGGLTTDLEDLTDEMYSNPTMHDENGAWQMIFSVVVHPKYQGMGYAKRLMNAVIEDVRKQNRKGIVLTCKEKLIPFYSQFGFVNEGESSSTHGGAKWYQMRLVFDKSEEV